MMYCLGEIFYCDVMVILVFDFEGWFENVIGVICDVSKEVDFEDWFL